MLESFSKLELVHLGRRLGMKMGDYARTNKEELILQLQASGKSDEDLLAMGSSGSQLLSPTAVAPVPVTSAPVRIDFSAIKVVSRVRIVDLFKLRGNNAKMFGDRMVDIWNDPSAPKVMDGFKWRALELLAALNCMARKQNVWLGGPAGTGKTEFVKQLCAKLGRCFVRVQFNSGTEAYDIIGGERVRAGSSYWQDGIVLQAFRHPGAVILLDEIGFARSEYTSDLHAALEPAGEVTVACTGEVITKADGVMFFAADNSNGRGDSTGTYVGITEKNEAFLSRFSKFLNFSYMSVAEEASIVADVAQCNKQVATLVAQFIAVCRSNANTGKLESPPSMREAFALAGALADGEPPRYAFETTVCNRAPQDCQEILQQLWVANVTDDIVAAALAGESVKVKGDHIFEVVDANEE